MTAEYGHNVEHLSANLEEKKTPKMVRNLSRGGPSGDDATHVEKMFLHRRGCRIRIPAGDGLIDRNVGFDGNATARACVMGEAAGLLCPIGGHFT